MNSSDQKPDGIVITFMDTTESEMLASALNQIQIELENHMALERLYQAGA